jgi:hypothetical protein
MRIRAGPGAIPPLEREPGQRRRRLRAHPAACACRLHFPRQCAVGDLCAPEGRLLDGCGDHGHPQRRNGRGCRRHSPRPAVPHRFCGDDSDGSFRVYAFGRGRGRERKEGRDVRTRTRARAQDGMPSMALPFCAQHDMPSMAPPLPIRSPTRSRASSA